MTARDIYRYINELENDTIQQIIERLEFRGKDPTFSGWLKKYLHKLELEPSAHVQALGCGTGVEAGILAGMSGFSGHIVGIDQSPALIEAAQQFAKQEGLSQHVDFLVGDVLNLEYAEASFDAVIAHTLISHVADPLALIEEATRLTKPNCQIAIFDGDYASWTFAYSDPNFAKKVDETLVGFIVNNPRVMRTLPRLLTQAGLALEEMTPHILAEVGKGSFFLGAAETYAPLLVKAGLLPEDKMDSWLKEQRRSHEEGTFFAAGNYYTYLARRI